MADAVKPVVGQWWRIKDTQILGYVCGVDIEGAPIVQKCELPATRSMKGFLETWEYVPDCTGFDWKPPAEVFPQYWSTVDGPGQPAAYIRRESETRCTIVYKNGTDRQDCTWRKRDPIERTRITKEQAEALIQKPVVEQPVDDSHRHYLAEQLGICPGVQKPVDSPDDWVVQDRVPARPGIDERGYRHRTSERVHPSSWADAEKIKWDEMLMYGRKLGDIVVHIRCRRKDLPPLTEVLPSPIESYMTVEENAPLQDGDLLIDGGLCYAVPSQYFGQSARDVKIPGYEDVFFLRDTFIAPTKVEPVDPTLVLETLAHMRDQFAALCKRVERLERNAEPF